MGRVLEAYRNGNYCTIILSDGTKIRFNGNDHFAPDFAENIDCTITTKCNGSCEFCYLGCDNNGVHANLNQPFFNTLHRGQELAINGNDLTHPDLEDFLIRMKHKGVIVNITVNQKHFVNNIDLLRSFTNRGLIKGIGISLNNLYNFSKKDLSYFPNAVIHVIDGLFTKEDLENLLNLDTKLLVLGYKKLGRGDKYYNEHKEEIENNIKFLRENLFDYKNYFKVISFDNLALEHLNIKNQISLKEWKDYYMGEEGQFTFYIDAVNKKFAISSTEEKQYGLLDNVDDMFKEVRRISNNE